MQTSAALILEPFTEIAGEFTLLCDRSFLLRANRSRRGAGNRSSYTGAARLILRELLLRRAKDQYNAGRGRAQLIKLIAAIDENNLDCSTSKSRENCPGAIRSDCVRPGIRYG